MTTLTQTTEIVNFRNQPLITLKVGEIIYTAIRPIVEGMGLDWKVQYRKLMSNKEKFNCVHMNTTAQDGKIREMLCIPIKKLNGWLFSINPEKVKPEIKQDVIEYQEECFETLYNYWHKGEAVNPRFEKITETQAHQLKSAVEKRCKANSEHYQTVWTALKHCFQVTSYKNILVKDFDNALNLVWTINLPEPVILLEKSSMVHIHDLSRLGSTKVEANRASLEIIHKALTMIDYASAELRKNNATHHGVFENIFMHSI